MITYNYNVEKHKLWMND